MEVDVWTEEHITGPEGTCKACLYEDELDRDGLCASCNPISPETRTALIALLNADELQNIKEVIDTSENK
jgi:hypothetical protein